MTLPLVSVATGTRNIDGYLLDALESILNQILKLSAPAFR